MAQRPQNRITVLGYDLVWSILRQPQWCTTVGWKGMAIEVLPESGSGRSLVVQLPFEVEGRRSTPHRQRPMVDLSVLNANIEAAMDAGWVPGTRGKPFQYDAKTSNYRLERP